MTDFHIIWYGLYVIHTSCNFDFLQSVVTTRKTHDILGSGEFRDNIQHSCLIWLGLEPGQLHCLALSLTAISVVVIRTRNFVWR
jgi:hypothetical protein